MAQEITSQSIAEKIYEKDTKNLLKSAIEKDKETEGIREVLEIAMTGLDNDGRFYVLSQINRRIESGDQFFINNNGINIDKIKNFAIETSKKVIEEKQSYTNDIVKNGDIKDKENSEERKALIESKKEELSLYIKDLSTEGQGVIAGRMLDIEENEERVQILISQGLTREEALNKVYNGNQKLIVSHELGIKAKVAIEKAKLTEKKEDSLEAESALEEFSFVEISSEIENLKHQIEEDKDSLKRLGKELTPEDKDKIQQRINTAKQKLDRLEEDKKRLEVRKAEREGRKKQEDIKNSIDVSEIQNDNSKLLSDAEEKTLGIKETQDEIQTNGSIKINKVEDIKLLLNQGVTKRQINGIINEMKNVFSVAKDKESFLALLQKDVTEQEQGLYQMLADLDYGDDLETILEGDSEIDILATLNDVLAQIEQTQDIDKTQTESQPLPEDVSAELNAIPVALQRINCSPEDITKGMEAYKQIIDGLTTEEIEGTPDMITQTLQKEVEVLGLDGVAGDILKMMSQITFNGQISEILKTCKDAFLASLETLDLNGPLLDPRVYAVNPEQYAESSVASTLTERIGEDSLKTGFAALAVDLQVAEQTIIRPEELVTDGVEQRKDDQVEVTEITEHEEKKDSTENSVIKKLQSFFGVYQNARTSDSDLEEEISDLELATQKMIEDMQMQATQNGQVVQQGNKPPVQPEKEDEDLEQ